MQCLTHRDTHYTVSYRVVYVAVSAGGSPSVKVAPPRALHSRPASAHSRGRRCTAVHSVSVFFYCTSWQIPLALHKESTCTLSSNSCQCNSVELSGGFVPVCWWWWANLLLSSLFSVLWCQPCTRWCPLSSQPTRLNQAPAPLITKSFITSSLALLLSGIDILTTPVHQYLFKKANRSCRFKKMCEDGCKRWQGWFLVKMVAKEALETDKDSSAEDQNWQKKVF